MPLTLRLVLPRQTEEKRGALIQCALGPDPAKMLLHDALDDGQTNHRAGKFLAPVQALEHAEQPVDIGHVKADAIVLDAKDAFFALVESGYLHAWANPGRTVLQCVRYQVHPDLAQQGLVAQGLGKLPIEISASAPVSDEVNSVH